MNLLVTDAGLAALVNAEATGTETITISEIRFGSGQYTPTKTQTAMQAPFKTLTALSGGAVSANTLHVTAEDASTETYSVYEVGVFLTDGTLFAVGSQNTAILQKASAAIALLSVDIALADHSAATVTVGDTNFFNPQATTEVKGVVELATADETKAGTDDTRAVTPASLKAELDVRDSKVVHTTGDELIYGEKTFTSRPVVKNGGPSLALVQTDIEKGTAPSAPQYSYIDFRDKAWKTLGSVTSVFDAAKASTIRLTAYKASSAEDSETASVELIYPADGSPYAMAPTPDDADDSSTKIATTAWVKAKTDKYLPLAGGTMTGTIRTSASTPSMSEVETTDNILICGGTSQDNGGSLFLFGKDHAELAGNFVLRAHDGTNVSSLYGKPDGSLVWQNKNLVRTVNSVSADAAGNVVITDISGSAGSAGSCTGNAATASKLESKFTIDGVMSDGSVAVLHYAACSTAADTAAKTVTLSNFNLVTGSKLCVRFTVTNTASAPTLNVNGTGAKPIKYRGNAISSAYLEANRIYEFVYDGSGYALVGDVVYVDNVVTNGSSNPVSSIAVYEKEKELKNLINENTFSLNAFGLAFNYGLLWLLIEVFDGTSDINTSVGDGLTVVTNYYDATNHIIAIKSGTVTFQSTAQSCSKSNGTVWAYADWEGSGTVKVEISRDNGTTFTEIPSNVLTDISSQPAGTQMVCRITMTGQATLKNIAWGCK